MEKQAPNTNPVKPPSVGEPKPAPGVTPAVDEMVTLSKAELDALTQRAKSAEGRLAKLDKDQEAAAQAALEEQGKWQEIADKKAKEADDIRKELFAEKATSTLLEEARTAGAVNPKAVLKLALATGELHQDERGTVLNAADTIKAIMAETPELFKTPGPQGKTPPPDGNPHAKPGSTLEALQAELQEETKKPGGTQDAKKIMRLTEQINKARKAG